MITDPSQLELLTGIFYLFYFLFVIFVSVSLYRMKTVNPDEYNAFSASFWYWFIHPIGLFYMIFYVGLGSYKKASNKDKELLKLFSAARIFLLIVLAIIVYLFMAGALTTAW